MRQQARHALPAKTRDAAILGFPEPAVMDQHRVRAALDGRLDQRLAGGDAANDLLNALAPFHLQAVWAIIPEARRLQQRVQIGAKILT